MRGEGGGEEWGLKAVRDVRGERARNREAREMGIGNERASAPIRTKQKLQQQHLSPERVSVRREPSGPPDPVDVGLERGGEVVIDDIGQ